MIKVGIGQDSHKFDFANKEKKLILGGIVFKDDPPLKANSDGDVVLHSITNAVSGITGINVLGQTADDMCIQGITDSSIYLKAALSSMLNCKINSLSISIECKKPNITPKIDAIKDNLAILLNMNKNDIGITATTGEELTEFGKGKGIHVFSCITVDII